MKTHEPEDPEPGPSNLGGGDPGVPGDPGVCKGKGRGKGSLGRGVEQQLNIKGNNNYWRKQNYSL